ncbi:MAG: hypothetical protein IJ272_05785 [Clostridia bacterium]|nr:hypothetical protein [Clostridia bacterium]
MADLLMIRTYIGLSQETKAVLDYESTSTPFILDPKEHGPRFKFIEVHKYGHMYSIRIKHQECLNALNVESALPDELKRYLKEAIKAKCNVLQLVPQW